MFAWLAQWPTSWIAEVATSAASSPFATVPWPDGWLGGLLGVGVAFVARGGHLRAGLGQAVGRENWHMAFTRPRKQCRRRWRATEQDGTHAFGEAKLGILQEADELRGHEREQGDARLVQKARPRGAFELSIEHDGTPRDQAPGQHAEAADVSEGQ